MASYGVVVFEGIQEILKGIIVLPDSTRYVNVSKYFPRYVFQYGTIELYFFRKKRQRFSSLVTDNMSFEAIFVDF